MYIVTELDLLFLCCISSIAVELVFVDKAWFKRRTFHEPKLIAIDV